MWFDRDFRQYVETCVFNIRYFWYPNLYIDSYRDFFFENNFRQTWLRDLVGKILEKSEFNVLFNIVFLDLIVSKFPLYVFFPLFWVISKLIYFNTITQSVMWKCYVNLLISNCFFPSQTFYWFLYLKKEFVSD